MQLDPGHIHIWSCQLSIPAEQEAALLALLSRDERERANRFHFPHHRLRFIAARGALRCLLSRYLDTEPANLAFAYTDHHKPYLPHTALQFNLSHSHDLAVFALTLDHAIGIDIERIDANDHVEIAKRYFSPDENATLLSLPASERQQGFYQIWSRKEAVIKALGTGLAQSLTDFSATNNPVLLNNDAWTVLNIHDFPGFACSLATNQPVVQLINQGLV